MQLYNDSYSLQAAQRSEKRRLSGFIHLLDYMVADCVHSMVEASLNHMLHSLKGRLVVELGTVNNNADNSHSGNSSDGAAADPEVWGLISKDGISLGTLCICLCLCHPPCTFQWRKWGWNLGVSVHASCTIPQEIALPMGVEAAPKPTSSSSDIVVLQLEILLQQQHNILSLQPHAQDY